MIGHLRNRPGIAPQQHPRLTSLPLVLADVIRARAAYASLKSETARLEATLLDLADCIESHAPGVPAETMATLETQAARYEVVHGFPDLGGHASALLDDPSEDHSVTLRRLAALALLDAHDELRTNSLGLPRVALQDEGLDMGYGLHPWEVQAAIDGVELDENYFAGSRTETDLAAMARPAHEAIEPGPSGSARRQGRRTGRRRRR